MTPTVHPIATVVGAGSQTVQALFKATVADWRTAGAKVVGVISETHGLADRTCSAGLLRDIVSGKPFSIYLETVPAPKACHLDAAGVNAASADIIQQVLASDLVVLSKFGKLEAAGSGLVSAFEAAIAAGKPILTSVSDRHRDAWQAFAPDAIYLPAEEAALRTWWRSLGLPRRHQAAL